jgi:hypothetical protein
MQLASSASMSSSNGHGFVVDGWTRLARTAEMQERRKRIAEEISTDYAKHLSQAGFFRRAIIRWQMLHEFRDRCEMEFGSPDYLLF